MPVCFAPKMWYYGFFHLERNVLFLGRGAGGGVKSGIIPSAKGTTKVGLMRFNKISRIFHKSRLQTDESQIKKRERSRCHSSALALEVHLAPGLSDATSSARSI